MGPEPVEVVVDPELVEGVVDPVPKGIFVVYFLRLRSGVLYVGASADLEQRLDAHASGQAGRTTRLDPPISLLRFEAYPSFSAARRREAQLKRWSRAKKEALLRGDPVTLRALSQSRESRNPAPADP